MLVSRLISADAIAVLKISMGDCSMTWVVDASSESGNKIPCKTFNQVELKCRAKMKTKSQGHKQKPGLL